MGGARVSACPYDYVIDINSHRSPLRRAILVLRCLRWRPWRRMCCWTTSRRSESWSVFLPLGYDSVKTGGFAVRWESSL